MLAAPSTQGQQPLRPYVLPVPVACPSQTTAPPGIFQPSPGDGMFHGSHHLTFDNSVFQIINNNNDMEFKTLKRLAEHTMRGAGVDSSERYPFPTCHPKTRIMIRNNIKAWRSNNNTQGRVLWLNGPAGVGKSSIMQTLAETNPGSKPSATLFFSRPHKRNNPQLVFNTIAYQLAVKDSLYRKHIVGLVGGDPEFPKKSLGYQFRTYIEKPFGMDMLHQGSEPVAIYIDALDECKGEEAQMEIINLIGQFAREYPTAPLVWIISSRREPLLEVAFEDLEEDCWDVEVPIASPESLQDVCIVLGDRFRDIRKMYPNSMPMHSKWPSDAQFRKIAQHATGMFAFAETVVRFVGDPRIANPIAQLERIIAALNKSEAIAMANGTFPDIFTTLDDLYREILSDVPDGVWPDTKRLLAYALNGDQFSFLNVCNLLRLKQHDAFSALHRLHSVVNIPQLGDAPYRHLHFYHSSFSEYLQDPTRSKKFSITQEEADAVVWEGHFRILQRVDKLRPQVQIATEGVELAWIYDAELDNESQQDLFRDAHTCWALDFNDWTRRLSTGEFSLEIPLILEAINTVDYGNLRGWMPITEMRDFLRSVKRLLPHIQDVPVRRIAIKYINFEAIQLGGVAYATCEAFGALRSRDEFPEWEAQHVGIPPNPGLEGILRCGTAWYYALGIIQPHTMSKIWADLNVHRNSDLDAFIFGTGERCCLFVEFETQEVETWSYVIPYEFN